MQKLIFRFRSWLANKLIKLAIFIRPNEEKTFLQSMQDAMMFGTGVMRIVPKDIFKEQNQ